MCFGDVPDFGEMIAAAADFAVRSNATASA